MIIYHIIVLLTMVMLQYSYYHYYYHYHYCQYQCSYHVYVYYYYYYCVYYHYLNSCLGVLRREVHEQGLRDFFCAVLERIRRLRKSPQYLLALLLGNMAASANLRKRIAKATQKYVKLLARKFYIIGIVRCPLLRGPLIISLYVLIQPYLAKC